MIPITTIRRRLKSLRYELLRRTHPRYSGKKNRRDATPANLACGCGDNHHERVFDWSRVDRPLIFTYRHNSESFASIQLRTFQVARLLAQTDPLHPITIQPLENLARSRPRGSIIIVGRTGVRPLSEKMIRRFIADGNLVLFDMVDGQVSPLIEHLPHAYVCSSMSEAKAREAKGIPTIVSLMSPDQRCPVADFSGKPFSVGYHGLAKNALHLNELSDLQVVDYREQPPARGELPMPMDLDVMAGFSHHYSVRAWNPGDGFKPLMKAYVAARLGACFIGSSEDEECRLVLSNDYPYLAASSSLDNVTATINYARETYGGPVWEGAVLEMKRLRRLSCPFATAEALIRGLGDLVERESILKSPSARENGSPRG
jgi:hypothetical protein